MTGREQARMSRSALSSSFLPGLEVKAGREIGCNDSASSYVSKGRGRSGAVQLCYSGQRHRGGVGQPFLRCAPCGKKRAALVPIEKAREGDRSPSIGRAQGKENGAHSMPLWDPVTLPSWSGPE